jgi:hypothetical protein
MSFEYCGPNPRPCELRACAGLPYVKGHSWLCVRGDALVEHYPIEDERLAAVERECLLPSR